MRKKSHVSLANHIIGQSTMIRHTGAFKLGSMVPDLVPSFITKKHEINSTFDILERKMNKVVSTYDEDKGLTSIHTKDLGVITHYLADYFTFPHNRQYPGSLKDHCMYEKELKLALKAYVRSVGVDMPLDIKEQLDSVPAICTFIKKRHDEYVSHMQNVQSDCSHIVKICVAVVTALTQLMKQECYELKMA